MTTKTTRRSIELLKRLTPKQQAALHMEAMADMNADEATLIRQAVPMKTYRARHAVYEDWISAIHHMALVAAGQYWRLSALHGATVVQLMQLARQQRESASKDTGMLAEMADREDETTERLQQIRTERNAVLRAVRTVCTDNEFSFAAVMATTGLTGLPEDLELFDQGVYQDWLAAFDACLPRYEPHLGIRNEPA